MRSENENKTKSLDISNLNLKLENFIKFNFKFFIRDIFDSCIRRNLYYFKYKNFFKKQNYSINLVLPSKGFSDLERKKKLNSIKNLKGKKILCIGCGNGFELLTWLKFKPSYIKGIDIFNYSRSWKKINNFVLENNFKTKVELIRKNILDLEPDDKFDFIVSDAVFEHLQDFEKVINFFTKLLNDDGIIYASYGPLWYSHGGDHFSGRDKIENGCNHILLNKKDYSNYYNMNVGNIEYEIQNKGSGGLFVKEELFSKIRGNEYMDIFNRNNLISNYTVVEFCPIGYKLIMNNPDLKQKIVNKYPNIDIEDFYLKTQIVYLKKKNKLKFNKS